MALTKILVVYASSSGATEEIAKRIASDVIAYGAKPILASVEENPVIEHVDAVIFGSGIRVGKFHKAASDWLSQNILKLETLPFAIFSVGLKAIAHNKKGMQTANADLQKNIDLLKPLAPVDQIAFPGWKKEEGFSQVEKLQLKMYPLEPGDYRDWDMVDRWVKEIMPKLIKR